MAHFTDDPRESVDEVFMSLALGDESRQIGTLRFKLFVSTCPKTCRNFVTLLTKPAGEGYKHSTFHRIIPNFMAQGGDYQSGDGTGGESIYGPTFEDENLTSHQHSQRGMLAMANSGPHTNGSQFYITFRPTPHLDGKHVVFGQLDENHAESWDVLKALEQVRVQKSNNKPLVPVVIMDCGIIQPEVNGNTTKTSKIKLLEKYTAKGSDDASNDDNDEKTEDIENKGNPTSQNGESDNDQIESANVPLDHEQTLDAPGTSLFDNQEYAEELETSVENPVDVKKMTPLQRRLHDLKLKMNQSRKLNRKEVLHEGDRIEQYALHKKNLKMSDKQRQEAEWETITAKTAGSNKKERQAMSQTAAHYSQISKKKQTRAELNRFSVDDYYNPQGQCRNYERSVKSVPRPFGPSTEDDDDHVFDPINATVGTVNTKQEKAGARRLAGEMQRRIEKTKESREKRDRADFEGDVGYINQRNKRFNEKISRNFDKHTAEIRHNLERGTAS